MEKELYVKINGHVHRENSDSPLLKIWTEVEVSDTFKSDKGYNFFTNFSNYQNSILANTCINLKVHPNIERNLPISIDKFFETLRLAGYTLFPIVLADILHNWGARFEILDSEGTPITIDEKFVDAVSKVDITLGLFAGLSTLSPEEYKELTKGEKIPRIIQKPYNKLFDALKYEGLGGYFIDALLVVPFQKKLAKALKNNPDTQEFQIKGNLLTQICHVISPHFEPFKEYHKELCRITKTGDENSEISAVSAWYELALNEKIIEEGLFTSNVTGMLKAYADNILKSKKLENIKKVLKEAFPNDFIHVDLENCSIFSDNLNIEVGYSQDAIHNIRTISFYANYLAYNLESINRKYGIETAKKIVDTESDIWLNKIANVVNDKLKKWESVFYNTDIEKGVEFFYNLAEITDRGLSSFTYTKPEAYKMTKIDIFSSIIGLMERINTSYWEHLKEKVDKLIAEGEFETFGITKDEWSTILEKAKTTTKKREKS